MRSGPSQVGGGTRVPPSAAPGTRARNIIRMIPISASRRYEGIERIRVASPGCVRLENDIQGISNQRIVLEVRPYDQGPWMPSSQRRMYRK